MNAKHIVIIGANFVGMEMASALKKYWEKKQVKPYKSKNELNKVYMKKMELNLFSEKKSVS